MTPEGAELATYQDDVSANLAPMTGPPPGIIPTARGRTTWRRALRYLLHQPSFVLDALNAQLRLRRVARVPFTVRLLGRARVVAQGQIVLGERVLMVGNVTPVELIARPRGRIEIGDNTFINYGVSISAHQLVSIGRDCHIGHYVFLYDDDYHEVMDKLRLPEPGPIRLGDRVWLGTRVTVLKGVSIGHDTVVGAGSVVTHDLPPRCVAAGVPARIVRRF